MSAQHLGESSMNKKSFVLGIIAFLWAARACLASPLDWLGILGIRPDFYEPSVIAAELGIQPSGDVAKPYRTIRGVIPGNFAQWSPNGRWIAITSNARPVAVNGQPISQTNSEWVGPIEIWDVTTGDKVVTLSPQGTYEESSAMAWSPDGRFFAACTDAWTANAMIWDTRTWKMIGEIPWSKGDGAPLSCSDLSFTPDSKVLAVGLNGSIVDNRVAFYQAGSWKPIQHIKIHQAFPKISGPIRFALVPGSHSPVSDWIVAQTAQDPGKIFMIDLRNESPSNFRLVSAKSWLAYRSTMLMQFAMSHHGAQFATSTLNGSVNHYGAQPQRASVRLWNAQTGAMEASPLDGLDEKAGFVSGFAYTFNDRYLAVGYEGITGRITLIDPATFKIVDTLHVESPVTTIIADPAAPLFAVATYDGDLMIWSLR